MQIKAHIVVRYSPATWTSKLYTYDSDKAMCLCNHAIYPKTYGRIDTTTERSMTCDEFLDIVSIANQIERLQDIWIED